MIGRILAATDLTTRSEQALGRALQTRRVIDSEVFREVALVTVAGRRFSPAVAAFVRAIKSYGWPQ